MSTTTRMLLSMAMIALVLTGCARRASGPPEIVLDRSACSKCRMLISDLSYSASLRDANGGEKTFDDLGCLVKFVRSAPQPAAKIWVHDHVADTWLDASRAHFVISRSIHGPMGGEVVAFGDAATARNFASQQGGAVVTSLGALLQKGTN